MLDHVGIAVSDFVKAKAFYQKALASLRYAIIMEGEGFAGFGAEGKPDFWIGPGKPAEHVHIAFAAPDRATVDRFYKAAMAAGGRDNGPPGLRPHYHPNYYGAFVLDPDGTNIEAVCHKPE